MSILDLFKREVVYYALNILDHIMGAELHEY